MTKTVTLNGTKYPVEYGVDTELPFIRAKTNANIIDVVYLVSLTKLGVEWKYDGIDIDALPQGKYESNAYASPGQLADAAHRTFVHHGNGQWREATTPNSAVPEESVKVTVQDYADRGLLYQLRLGAVVK